MLTEIERQFMDLWMHEELTQDYDGYAQKAARSNGITYDHFAQLGPVYKRTWEYIGEWPDHLPPLPPNLKIPCPWESAAAMEARITELRAEKIS